MPSPCSETEKPKYWLAVGMIEPEWIYANPFLHHETQEKEEKKQSTYSSPISPNPKMRIHIRARHD